MKKLCLLAIFCAAAAQGQIVSMSIGAPVFSGSGLNDATSGGVYVGSRANHSYTAAVCGVGATDAVQFTRDGVGSTGCTVAVSTSPQALFFSAGAISTASWSGGIITYTTVAPHGLTTAELVTVDGASPSAYNIAGLSAIVLSSTTFSVAVATNPGTYTSGGTIYASDGLTIQWGAATGHTLAAEWSVSATGNAAPPAFIQAGVGAVVRAQQAKERDVISLKDQGGVGDDSTDNTAAWTNVFATWKNVFVPPGVYRWNTTVDLPQGATVTCAGQTSTVLHFVGGGYGFSYQGYGVNGSANLVFRDCGFVSDGSSSTGDVYLNDAYEVKFDHNRHDSATDFAESGGVPITAASTNVASAAFLTIDNGGGGSGDSGNSAAIVLDGEEMQSGSGGCVLIKSENSNGVARLNIKGGHCHSMQGTGIATSVLSSGSSNEIDTLGWIDEGNTGGGVNVDWCLGCEFLGTHFENSGSGGGATATLFTLGIGSRGVRIAGSTFAGTSATYCINLSGTSILNVDASLNNFTGCSTAINAPTVNGLRYGLSKYGTGTAAASIGTLAANIENLDDTQGFSFTRGVSSFDQLAQVTSAQVGTPLGGFGPTQNYIQNSNNFGGTGWTAGPAVTLSTSSTTAPDGSPATQYATASTGSPSLEAGGPTFGSAVSGTYTGSIWLQAASQTTVLLEIRSDTDDESATCYATAGTAWRQFYCSHDFTTTTRPILVFGLANNGQNNSATVNIWGADLAYSAFPPVYTPTSGTRSTGTGGASPVYAAVLPPAVFAPSLGGVGATDQFLCLSGTGYITTAPVCPSTGTESLSVGTLSTSLGGLGTWQNYLNYSQTFTNSAWTKGAAVTLTANAATAPDGTTTATEYATASSGSPQLTTYSPTFGGALSGSYICSGYIRTASGSSTMAVEVISDTDDEGINSEITVGSTWQRFSVTHNFTSTSRPIALCGLTNYADNNSKTAYVWGFQLENGTAPDIYAETTSAPTDITQAAAHHVGLIVNGVASIGGSYPITGALSTSNCLPAQTGTYTVQCSGVTDDGTTVNTGSRAVAGSHTQNVGTGDNPTFGSTTEVGGKTVLTTATGSVSCGAGQAVTSVSASATGNTITLTPVCGIVPTTGYSGTDSFVTGGSSSTGTFLSGVTATTGTCSALPCTIVTGVTSTTGTAVTSVSQTTGSASYTNGLHQ